MGQQDAGGDLTRRDGDVDAVALHQVRIDRVADQGHHLAYPEAFGQQRRHDVAFVVVGERQKHVDLVDVFFHQQVAVGGRAVQHHGAVEAFGQVHAALGGRLDDLDVVVALDGLRETEADVAAAG